MALLVCVWPQKPPETVSEITDSLKIFPGGEHCCTIRFPLQQILYKNLIYFSPPLNLTITVFAQLDEIMDETLVNIKA